MNDLNSPDLNSQVSSLQNQVIFLKLALVVLGGTLVTYLAYQSHIYSKDADREQQIAEPIIKAFQERYPMAEEMKRQLAGYAVTHPDFQPVLKKYGWVPPSGQNAAPAPVKK
jgi:hypothetical protein